LENAGYYLKDHYGQAALYIWAVGLLAAGQSSTMTGTYAGQFVMEGFLRLRISPWKRVLLTRSVAIVPAIIVAVVSHNWLDTLDEWINVLQSIQLPFALLPVLVFTNSKRIMGTFRNKLLVKIVVWLLGMGIIGVNIYQAINTVTSLPHYWYIMTISAVIGTLYVAVVLYLALGLKAVKMIYRIVTCGKFEPVSKKEEALALISEAGNGESNGDLTTESESEKTEEIGSTIN